MNPPVSPYLVSSLLALAACGCSGTSKKGSVDDGPIARLTTNDGLTLEFDTRTNRITRFGNEGLGASLDMESDAVGVSLADHRGAPLLDITRQPASLRTRRPDTLELVRENAESNLRMVEEWRAHPRHIELLATITDTGRTDNDQTPRPSRAIEACLELPMDLLGKSWFGHLHQSETIEPDTTYQTLLVDSLDIGHYTPRGFGSHLKTSLPINLHGLNAVGDDTGGLAIGAHPEAPAAYHVSYRSPGADSGPSAGARLRACFHLAIYPQHMTRPDQTSLRLVLMATDEPAWGLRSALDEYLAIFAEHARGTVPGEPGMTVGGSYRFEHYPAPERFHITNAWNALYTQSHAHGINNLLYAWPTGYIDRGVRLRARPAPGPCAECDRSMDAQVNACLDIYNDYEDGAVRFPQTCDDTWGQNGCRKSIVMPVEEKAYGPVRIRHSFYHLVPEQVVAPTDLVLRLFGKFAMYEPFHASILRGVDGRYEGALSDSHAVMPISGQKDVVTCYINGFNPDPGVRESRPRNDDDRPPVTLANFGLLNLEIAKRATGVYGTEYVHRDRDGSSHRFDGVALDTVGAYLRPDFNENMLRVASYPLAYDPESGLPVALEHLSLNAYIDELRRVLPAKAPIAINGYPISGTLGRGVDIFVRELARRYRKLPGDERPKHYYELYDEDEDTRLRRVFRARMVANQRPITFWARFLLNEERAQERGLDPEAMLEADMARYLPLYTAKGIYVYIQRSGLPGRDRFLGSPQSPRLLARYERHLDTVHALVKAGWQSVPHARTDDPAISVERFGQGHITLYNASAEERRVAVRIDWSRLARSGEPVTRVRDLETGAIIRFELASDGVLTTEAIAIPPYGVRVLQASSVTSSGDDAVE